MCAFPPAGSVSGESDSGKAAAASRDAPEAHDAAHCQGEVPGEQSLPSSAAMWQVLARASHSMSRSRPAHEELVALRFEHDGTATGRF